MTLFLVLDTDRVLMTTTLILCCGGYEVGGNMETKETLTRRPHLNKIYFYTNAASIMSNKTDSIPPTDTGTAGVAHRHA